MNITYKLIGKKNIKTIFVRVYHNKFDIQCSTNLITEFKDFENEQSKNDLVLNEHLLNLKLSILKEYNLSFANGIVINKDWLKNIVSSTYLRPKFEQGLINLDHTLYFVDFCRFWVENCAPKWKTASRKNMSKVLLSQYVNFIAIFAEYEKLYGSKILMTKLTQDEIYLFIEYLQKEKYLSSTITRITGRLRFFCNRASDQKINICNDFSNNYFLEDEQEQEGIYLNETEIDRIFNLDFADDIVLNAVKDNLIISCRTALRITDFMNNLKIDNIQDNIISIKTQKTGSFVKIPLHHQVKSILEKRFMQLPLKMSHSEYNKKLKIVCQKAKIDNIVFGKIFNAELKRKVAGNYPKYMLCTSHIGRKSFVSNLRGKVSDNLLASLGGWKNTKLLDTYNNKTKLDYAQELEVYFNNN